MLHLQGLVVEGIVVAGGQHKGTQQDTPLDLSSKALGAGFLIKVGQILVVLCPPAVFHAVKAGQVGGRLRRCNDIIGGNHIFHHRKLKLLQFCSPALQHLCCGKHLFPNLCIQTVPEAVHRDPHSHAPQVIGQVLQQVAAGGFQRCAVTGILPHNRVQHGGAVLGGPGQRANLI